jgi:MFS family permease
MGLTASCWSLGVVLGPVIGGFLANPGTLYPSVFADQGDETSFFVKMLLQYPYLLPNLVVGMFSFVACCLVYVCLPETLMEHVSSESESGVEVKKRGATVKELLNTPGVSFALSAYFVLSFIDLSFSEIIPLWAIASVAAGGLGMEQQRIGFLMTFTGCLQVAYTMIFYPIIVGYLGRVQSFRKGQMLFIPFCLGITLLNDFSAGSFTQFVLLVFMFAIARACCSLGNSSIGLIVNRCVQKEQRASINGLSMGIGSMAKAIGPMVSTYLFAWSINPPDGE